MTPSLIQQTCALIETRTGIAVGTQFRSDIAPILMQIAAGDIAALLRTLQTSSDSAPVWQRLVSALTIGETHFQRDKPYFEMLGQQILPELIRQRRAAQHLTLNIWSAGCATGEEPYSVAILLTELLPDIKRWQIRLVGTDINESAIRKAASGIYRPWAFRQTDSAFRSAYFDVVEGGVQIKPEIRQRVVFRQGNLLNGAPLPALDIILCRNLLLYLTGEAIQRAETLLYNALTPGGWLLLGQSEALRHHRERWQAHIRTGVVIYRKPAAPQAQPALPVLAQPVQQLESVYYQRPPERPAHPQPSAAGTPPAPPAFAGAYGDAVHALHTAQPQEAERILAGILAVQPDDARANTLLACIFANRQMLPEARAHLDAALRRTPMLADAHYLRAMLALESEPPDPAAAARSLRAALYCEPDHALAALMLGNLHERQGEADRARKAWQRAIRAATTLPPEAQVSDLSDITAGDFVAMLNNRLGSNGGASSP